LGTDAKTVVIVITFLYRPGERSRTRQLV
jgi:hypothetical protein